MFDSLRTRRPARGPHDGLHTTASSPLRERGGISADRVVFDSSLYTRAAVHPIAARLVGLALGLAAAAALLGRRRYKAP